MSSYADLMMQYITLQQKHVNLRVELSALTTDLRKLLSFIDDETKDYGYQEAKKKAPDYRPLRVPSSVECRTLSGVYPVSDEKGLAEVAAAIRGLTCCSKTIYRIESPPEVGISMCPLSRMARWEGSVSGPHHSVGKSNWTLVG